MPDVDQNLANWTSGWDWSQGGDDWSAWWGGTPAMWEHAVLPRIREWVPARTVLEIAPGFGRWTQYLKDLAERLVIVDLTPGCIDACRARFADARNIDYHVNDGRSLAMIDDASIDLAFSFDSLVHAEAEVVEAYVVQLARKLAPDGIGFVHHSNIGAYRGWCELTRRTPARLRGPLMKRGTLINLVAWRAESMTAERFAAMCDAAGLACISQERISWQAGRWTIDCLSTFTPRGSRHERPVQVVDNPGFVAEAAGVRQGLTATRQL
jgi:SAM-dependent methyltransferase